MSELTRIEVELDAERVDPVNHPPHYTRHPSGIECIQITRHMGFNLGNALKYIWRADLKGAAVEDLEKAVWYLKDEIEKRRKSGELGAAGTVKPASPTMPEAW